MSSGAWDGDGEGPDGETLDAGGAPHDALDETPSETLDDEALVRAMRRGEAAALQGFIERFHGVLVSYARKLRLRPEERSELAFEVLDDVALRLIASTELAPKRLRRYLVAALHHRFLMRRRSGDRHAAAVREAAEVATEGPDHEDERAAAAASESLMRASRGPDWMEALLSPLLERLTLALDEGLSEEERMLLIAVGENVPQREIALWLGVSHATARKRLERLRARLVDAAVRFGSALDREDGRELQRFLRRCGAGPPHAREPSTPRAPLGPHVHVSSAAAWEVKSRRINKDDGKEAP